MLRSRAVGGCQCTCKEASLYSVRTCTCACVCACMHVCLCVCVCEREPAGCGIHLAHLTMFGWSISVRMDTSRRALLDTPSSSSSVLMT